MNEQVVETIDHFLIYVLTFGFVVKAILFSVVTQITASRTETPTVFGTSLRRHFWALAAHDIILAAIFSMAILARDAGWLAPLWLRVSLRLILLPAIVGVVVSAIHVLIATIGIVREIQIARPVERLETATDRSERVADVLERVGEQQSIRQDSQDERQSTQDEREGTQDQREHRQDTRDRENI